ncbi:MAG: SDR family NAD(P)-dependent oxidoreductase [Alphaproteobacteria bacterium]|jgi:NAD(P)-dependent dehydrogenase (short-subunit alcohol dehydrogenase family)
MKDVKGKVAFITGAASGMGLGMARAFAAAGMKVMIADIEAEPAKRAADELTGKGYEAAWLQVDVTKLDAMHAAAKQTVDTFGKVHIISNNAGIGVFGMSETCDMRNWHWVVDVNLWGVVHGLQAFVPLIQAQGEGGHVSSTASMAGMAGLRGAGPYNATKFAVVGIMETFAAEHRKTGISASVLCPGLVATNIASSTRNRQEEYGGASKPSDKGISATELAKGLDPDAVGRQVLEAIQEDQFYIFTDPSLRHIIETRCKRILQGYDWAANCKALKGEKQAGALPGGLLTK